MVYMLVFYNISFSWLLPVDGFQFIFLCRVYCVTVKTKNTRFFPHKISITATTFIDPLLAILELRRELGRVSNLN